MGCDTAYTEMVSAMGYLCAPSHQATQRLMKRGPNEPKLIIQLFGKEPSVIAEAAAKIASLGIYDGIDINMGCPARKVASSGEGCGLMNTPKVAWAIMKETVQAVQLPVSVKIRLGWDEDHICAGEFISMAAEAGVCEVTVHGRTKVQQYSGTADWDLIRRLKETAAIPVIGNGDLFGWEAALEKQRSSRVDGIMIGRGALGNPWIFRDIRCALTGKEIPAVSGEERFQMIRRHFDCMLAEKPERIAVQEMRKHIGWYLSGIRGAGKARAIIIHMDRPDEIIGLIGSLCGKEQSKLGEIGYEKA